MSAVELARQRYDDLTAEFRVLDRWLTNVTVFGNHRWTPEMLQARRILVAMLNKRLRELSAQIAEAFAVYLDMQEALDAAELEVEGLKKVA